MTSRATSTKTAPAARKKKATRTSPPKQEVFESQLQDSPPDQMASTLEGIAKLIRMRGLSASKMRRSNVTYSTNEKVSRIEISLDIPSVNPG